VNQPIVRPTEQQLFAVLANDAPIGWVAVDGELRVSWANSGAVRLFGFSDLVGRSAFELVHPDDLWIIADSLLDFESATRSTIPTILRIRSARGEYLAVEAWVQHSDPKDPAMHFVLAVRDACATVNIENYVVSSLQGSELRSALGFLLRSIEAQLAGHVTLYWGWNGQRYDHAVATCKEFEYLPDTSGLPGELPGTLPWITATNEQPFAESTDFTSLPTELQDIAAREAVTSCRAQNISTPSGQRGALVLWDKSSLPLGAGGRRLLARMAELAMLALERSGADAQLKRRASTDSLTNLANRAVFMDELAALIESETPGTLILTDLDGFKAVNDRHGHPVGDKVLAVVAKRLLGAVRSGDLVARLGGDEFGILLHGESADLLPEIRDRVLAACREPVAVETLAGVRSSVLVGISMGVAFTADHPSSDGVISAADRALYRAKDGGHNGFCYDDSRARPRATASY
jgi:diguanylate cyclase (GGDEF)-like protein